MLYSTLKNTRHGSLPGNGRGGFITAIKHPSPGSFIMGKYKTKPTEKRLLNKIIINVVTGCWEYTGRLDRNGYGVIGVNYKTCLAHRVAYSVFVGPIPNGLFVCHKCDNRKCINPDHLFVGTHQDNMDDMVRKGRSSKAGCAMLFGNNNRGIPVIAENIMFKSYKEASRYIGVSDNTIRKRIKNGWPGYKSLGKNNPSI